MSNKIKINFNHHAKEGDFQINYYNIKRIKNGIYLIIIDFSDNRKGSRIKYLESPGHGWDATKPKELFLIFDDEDFCQFSVNVQMPVKADGRLICEMRKRSTFYGVLFSNTTFKKLMESSNPYHV